MKNLQNISYQEFHNIMERIEKDSYSNKNLIKESKSQTQFSSVEEMQKYYNCRDFEDFVNDVHKKYGI